MFASKQNCIPNHKSFGPNHLILTRPQRLKDAMGQSVNNNIIILLLLIALITSAVNLKLQYNSIKTEVCTNYLSTVITQSSSIKLKTTVDGSQTQDDQTVMN